MARTKQTTRRREAGAAGWAARPLWLCVHHCGSAFASAGLARLHEKRACPLREVKCRFCSRTDTAEGTAEHEARCRGRKTCPHGCGFEGTAYLLRRHLATAHGNAQDAGGRT